MSYLQLRAFNAVAEEGSFTKAAERLGVTQPTLSGQVRELEERHGVKLFERQGRGVVLTDTGRRLREVTQRLLTEEAEAEALLASARGLRSGRLRVMADAPHLVMPILGAYRRRHPGIQLSIGFGNARAVLLALKDRRCDVGLMPGPIPDDSLIQLLLKRDRLVAMVARGHPWSQRRSVGLEELAGEALLLREPGSSTRACFEAALEEAGLANERVLEVGSREAVAEGVAAGLGVGLVVESEFGNDRRLHKLEIKGGALTTTEYLVAHPGHRQQPPVAAFFDLAKEAAA
ncbi:LysR substrate-binding domain-containing protein [Limibacillus halophilus]